MNAVVAPKSAYEQLSNRDRLLLEAYFDSRTATDAVRKVQPNAARPDVIASKWKAKPLVQKAISERRLNLLDAVGVSQEMIVREWKILAFGDIRELYDEQGRLKPMHELTPDQAALIASLDSDEIFADPQQNDLFASSGDDHQPATHPSSAAQSQGSRVVIGLRKRFKRWNKVEALRALSEMARLSGGGNAGVVVNAENAQIAVQIVRYSDTAPV
jgi:Terminase small subunit